MSTTTRFLRKQLTVAAALLLASGGPLKAQVEDGPGVDAELGESHQLGERRPLEFTLISARHALGWTHHTRYGTPTADEKMLVLRFSVRNVGEEAVEFSYTSLDFVAVDGQSVGHARENPIAVYLDGTEDELDMTLRPTQYVVAYTAILLPADRSVSELIVEPREADAAALRYDLSGAIDPLPEVLRGDGQQAVKQPLEGRAGFFYPTGAFDVRVRDVETRTDPEIDGWTLDDDMKWAIVTLDVRSRFDETLPVTYREFRGSRLIDDFGDDYENIRSLHPRRDREFDGEVAPGEIETIRLLYEIFDDAEPEALSLSAETPSGDDGLVTRVAFSSEPFPEDAARAQLLGDGRASTFAAGVYDPLDRTVAVVVADMPELIVPAGETLIPDSPEEDESGAEGDGTGEDQGEAGDDMAKYVRDGSFRITAMRAEERQENVGDEPYYLLFKFSGILGRPETESTFAITGDRPFSYQGADWLGGGGPYTSLGNDHVFEFPALRPYEIYGIALVVMEDDASSAGEVERLGTAFAREARRRWLQTIDTPLDLDLSSADEDVQRAYVRAARRVSERFFGTTGSFGALSSEAFRYALDILGGIDDDDDYVDMLGAAWVNIPTLGREEFFSELVTREGAEYGFYSPREHIVRLEHFEGEMIYQLRLENRLSNQGRR